MSDELHLFADVEADATDGAYRYDPRSRTVRLNAVVTDGPADAVGRWVHVDVLEALSRRGDELRHLHHARVVLDANAREKIADIALDALGLLGPGDPCDCESRGQCHGAAICASVHPAEQCRQFTTGWPEIAPSGE